MRKMPLFFKIWFALVATMGLTIIAGQVYVLLHPEIIGEFVGRAVHGYQESAR